MKKTLIAISLLAAFAASAQDLSAQSGSSSQSAAGAQSGSVAAGNVIVFNPGTAGATATGAGGIPTTRVINEQDGTTTANMNSTSTGTMTSNQNVSGTTTANENVRYSGTVDNHTSGGTYSVSTDNVNYSGTQTIKNVPGIAMSGPASGPCTGASGGLGLAGPGWGLGLNGSAVMVDCRLRENLRVIGMAMQSLDGAANPQEKGEATVMFMDDLRVLHRYNQKIAGEEFGGEEVMDEFSDPVAIGKAMQRADLKGAPHYGTNYAELAGCLRGAVTAMEVLSDMAAGLSDALPGLPGLIERSKKALKEYAK